MTEERKEQLRLLYVGDLKAMADGTYKEPGAHAAMILPWEPEKWNKGDHFAAYHAQQLASVV